MPENNINIKNLENLQNLENLENKELYNLISKLKTFDTLKNFDFSIEKSNFFGERILLKFIFPENFEYNFNIIHIHIPFGETERAYEIHIHKQLKIYSFLCNNFNHLVSVILQLYNNPILQMYKNGSEYKSAFGRLNIVTGFNDNLRRRFGNQNRIQEFYHTPRRPFGIQSNPRREFGNQPFAFANKNRKLDVQPSLNFGSQPSLNFGSQPSPTFGIQPSPTFGIQPSPTFGIQPSPTFGSQPFSFGPNPIRKSEVNPFFGKSPFTFGKESESVEELESILIKKRKPKSNLEEDTKETKTRKTRKSKN